jgi:hypothetical protein
MQTKNTLLALLLAAGAAHAAVTPEEARQLGATLTATGAEKAGNKDGTIPEYAGMTAPPAGYVKGSGNRPDPFAADKPRLTLSGKNLQGMDDKLTAGTRELLKRYPNFRVDVYPTRRPVAFPKFIVENTAKNALHAKSVDGGVGLEGALAGVPFPIPKSGFEVMWNHLMRYQGRALNTKYESWNVDSSGVSSLATSGEFYEDFPLADPAVTEPAKQEQVYFRTKLFYQGPARRAGEAVMAVDAVNPATQPRRAWQYLPGQRRVKLAPDVAYDTPNPGAAGIATYDDAWVFNGALDRYDFKLVGKKEMIVPYNSFGAYDFSAKFEDVAGRDFIAATHRRYETHRVWVVEATVKAGMRHLAPKRTFFIDEDSWNPLVADDYDGQGKLWKLREGYSIPAYETGACDVSAFAQYNLLEGRYVFDEHAVGTGADVRWITEPGSHPRLNANFYTAENLRAISER